MLQIAALVYGQCAHLVGKLRCVALQLQGSGERKVTDGAPDLDLIGTLLHSPAVLLHVPVAEGEIVEGDGNPAGFPGLQKDLAEALQLSGGAEDPAAREPYVQLGYLGTVDGAGIGDGKGNAVRRDLQPGIGKSGIGEPEAEGIPDGLAEGIEIPVSHVNGLPVIGISFPGRVPGARRNILILLRIGFRQLAGRIDTAGKNVEHGAGAGLAGQVAVKHSFQVSAPGHLDGRTGTEHADHIGICLCDGFQHICLYGGNPHVMPVQSLGLTHLVQTEEIQDDIRPGGQLTGLLQEGSIRLPAAPVPAGHPDDRQMGLFRNHLLDGFQPGDIYHRGSGPLIAGLKGEISDDGNRGAFLQRENPVLVLQQHGAGGSRFPGQGMMPLLVKGIRGIRKSRGGCQHRVQQFVDAGVQIGFRELSDPDGLHQLAGGSQAGRRHFQIGPGFYGLHMVIGSAPVRDDKSVVSPLAAQDILQEVHAFVGIFAVHLVVGGHQRAGMAVPDGDFKPCQVNLPQSALIYDCIHGHPPLLLGVHGKVLETGKAALALNAFYIGGGHFAGQIRVFREILEIPPAERASLDVHSRAEQDMHAQAFRLLSKGLSDLLAESLIPAVRHGGRRRETGGRQGGIQSQMVSRAGLPPHTVRSV